MVEMDKKSPEISQFDRRVRDYLLEHPEAKGQVVADEMDVPITCAMRSVARLQKLNMLPDTRTESTQKNETVIDSVNKNSQETGVDLDEIFDSKKMVEPFPEENGPTKRLAQMIRSIQISQVKPAVQKNPTQPIGEINQIIKSLQKEIAENKKSSDVMSAERIQDVRDGLIRDLMLSETPMFEIRYFTRFTDHMLREAIDRLRKKGELPAPFGPDAG
jgi:hypothetical protein